jgi:hypothetical protein
VAVAEGTYPENLFINKQVKLWGVCPKKVTVSIPKIIDAPVSTQFDACTQSHTARIGRIDLWAVLA